MMIHWNPIKILAFATILALVSTGCARRAGCPAQYNTGQATQGAAEAFKKKKKKNNRVLFQAEVSGDSAR
jgi:hypothetical protein